MRITREHAERVAKEIVWGVLNDQRDIAGDPWLADKLLALVALAQDKDPAAALLGSRSSARKRASSAKNGRLGGRPRKAR
jgi:hypothetical protein